MDYESQEHYDHEMNMQADAENEMAANAAEGEQEDQRPTFLESLGELINMYSIENGSDTPDYLLAEYLSDCLIAYQKVVTKRDKWFGVDMWSENKLSKV